jgi:hypothetical protein
MRPTFRSIGIGTAVNAHTLAHTHTHPTADLGDKKTSIGEVGKTSQTGHGIPRTEGLTRHTEHSKLEDNDNIVCSVPAY